MKGRRGGPSAGSLVSRMPGFAVQYARINCLRTISLNRLSTLRFAGEMVLSPENNYALRRAWFGLGGGA